MATATKARSAKGKTAKKAAAATKAPAGKKKKEALKDLSVTYDQFKEFEGKRYTGMKVGRSHKWYYDKGEWNETKITPDLWEIAYAVTKRRAGKAPPGSGVPVGTAYHWYILAHQNVRKLNANDYTTSMTGLKLKLAHQRVGSEKWSLSARTQRKHLVEFLQELIVQLEKEPIPIAFEYNGRSYEGEAIPITQTCLDGICTKLDVILNDEQVGIIRYRKSGWKIEGNKDRKFVNAIAREILNWYNKK
ncbi:hypothetical protein [Chitinophaga japonensis]|uniref:Uncharacterized protein n=1 Tax=Chitinophaga japonensis TaxID=104662 RepID=A0A562TBZ6_CHIJA|nr:hypothetical protein [Chitinophaga japonensis]TWI91032.1 hypothetical protein LX66_0393 [Chitinophaga japonensis]